MRTLRTALTAALALVLLAPAAQAHAPDTASDAWTKRGPGTMAAPALTCSVTTYPARKYDTHMAVGFGSAECSSDTQMHITLMLQVIKPGAGYVSVYPTYTVDHFGTWASITGNVQCPPPYATRSWRVRVEVSSSAGHTDRFGVPASFYC